MNVLFLVEGRSDWSEWLNEWGHHLHLQVVDPKKLTKTVLEIVKYAAQAVPEKSTSNAAADSSQAPALVAWPQSAFREWWAAGQKFRRTRSYGCLYALEALSWDQRSPDNAQTTPRGRPPTRSDLCRVADVPTSVANTAWRDIRRTHGDDVFNQLLRSLRPSSSENTNQDVIWLGAIEFRLGQGYWVDLILGDNFFD